MGQGQLGRAVILLEDLREERRVLPLAQQYVKNLEEYEKAKREWEAAHPGETYELFGNGYSGMSSSTTGETEDILNINEYLSQNTKAQIGDAQLPATVSAALQTENEPDAESKTWIIISIIAAAAAFAAIVTVFILVKSSRVKKHAA